MHNHLKISFLPGLVSQSVLAQTTQSITLAQAQQQAIDQNRRLKIARYKVDESSYKITEARSRLYPLIVANSMYAYNGVTRDLILPRGSIGMLPSTTPSPSPFRNRT